MLKSECPNCGRLHEGADFTSLPRVGPVQAELDAAQESIRIIVKENGTVVSRQRRRITALEKALGFYAKGGGRRAKAVLEQEEL